MIHEYAFHGQPDKILRAIKYKNAVEQMHELDQGGFGFLPIHCAAHSGNCETIALLVEHGANIESRTSGSQAQRQAREVTTFFDVPRLHSSQLDKERTPLQIAAASGNLAACECLLKLGANPEARDNDDQTAVSIANEQKHRDVVDLLLQCGAQLSSSDKEIYSQTLVTEAKDFNLAEFVLETFLTEIGKDGKIDADEKAALAKLYHLLGLNEEQFFRIKKQAREKFTVDQHSGSIDFKSFFTTVLERGNECFGRESTLELLRQMAQILNKSSELESILPTSRHSKNKWESYSTEFLAAVSNNDIDRVSQLLQQGIDPQRIQDAAGFTPLMIAVYRNFHDIAELLLDVYRDLEQGDIDSGFTALAWAVRQNHLQMVQKLVQSGANVDARDRFGISIINMAYANASEEVFLALIKNSTCHDSKEINSWREWAIEKDWQSCLDFISNLKT